MPPMPIFDALNAERRAAGKQTSSVVVDEKLNVKINSRQHYLKTFLVEFSLQFLAVLMLLSALPLDFSGPRHWYIRDWVLAQA